MTTVIVEYIKSGLCPLRMYGQWYPASLGNVASARCIQMIIAPKEGRDRQVLIPQIKERTVGNKMTALPLYNDWQNAPEVPYLLMMVSRPQYICSSTFNDVVASKYSPQEVLIWRVITRYGFAA